MELINLTGNFDSAERGDPVVGKTSGAISKYLGFAVELGEIYLYLKEGTGTFVAGEIVTLNGIDLGEFADLLATKKNSPTRTERE